MDLTVRALFRLHRRALWEADIGVAIEFDKLGDAVAEGDECAARAVLGWILHDQPYLYGQLRERHRHRGILR